MNLEIPKKVLVINDMAGVGRCSMSVALPVISACKVQACPAPTALFSNHTGFQTFFKKDLTNILPDYFNGLNQIQATFDGIYCGYLGSVDQIDIVQDYLSNATDKPLIVLDPVMGDNGKIYTAISDAYCQKMKSFLSYADIITPNLTEACLLADIPYDTFSSITSQSSRVSTMSDVFHTVLDSSDLEKILSLCHKLHCLGAKKVIVTGLRDNTYFHNFVYESDDSYCFLSTKITGPGLPGTGDMFASIICALSLRGFSLTDAVMYASHFISVCVSGTATLKSNPIFGANFELFLGELFSL